ncbi:MULTISPECIES: sodium:alanine symporter family protein [unclassified Fibrobacter]|uniref:alanine/glycine:cation symporter family protein n=1 Tax=unclassified Fibrobacter TaxID=2634177 RepID=UPI000D6C32A0|nr:MULTISPECIES: sodium:alanine symporter family protein [unclassified Fibrobacter]PWJ61037.1 AGCS family alanine or glycine:cation symporter [Fibrobacter sp. UWR4]PZW68058.1 AGCS family alanine or glycine:cation symporter [Fibrobacter sp. UWR1]
MEAFTAFLDTIDGYVWGIPLIVVILFVGLLLTVRLGCLQVVNLPNALRYMLHNEKGGQGEVSSFGALCTALAATIGTGNIVGVATAIGTGGPGALFWMEMAAFFGMATKYAEGVLAVKYRKMDKDGKVLGGPFYYIETGLKERFGWNMKWLAVLFAIFGVCAGVMGIGTITQVNGITSAMARLTPNAAEFVNIGGNSVSITTAIAGVLVTAFSAFVIIGGLKRIAKVSTYIVPVMAILYILACMLLLMMNFAAIPEAIQTIVRAAFNPSAVTGGVVGTIFIAMQKGIARGIFSNEAGLGSAPIAAAAAKTNEPVRQGLVCMTGTFFDTIIICTMTGLAIVVSGAWDPKLGLEGVNITMEAFSRGLAFFPGGATIAPYFLAIALVFFAFTTILGWAYYSEKCLQYLIGGKKKKAILTYRWIYVAAIFIGPYLTVSAVWTCADIFNGLMAFPNLIALILLSGIVALETKDFLDRLHSGQVGE